MDERQLYELVGRLAPVRDNDVSASAGSPQSAALFERIVSQRPWRDGARRTRNRRVAVAAVAAAALAAAPALALRGHIVHAFSGGEQAAPRVAASFYELQRGAPPEWRVSAAARRVLAAPTPDGTVSVWAAPRAVGFCYAVGTAGRDGFASTCTDRSTELDPWPFTVEKPESERVGGPFVLVGYTLNHAAVSVRVRFDDGLQTTVPVRWVSPPIDAGFFAVWSAKEHWRDGKERFEAAALDEREHAVATSAIEVGAPTF